MSDSHSEQWALEVRVDRARAHLHQDVALLEDRGQQMLTTARHTAKTAAFVGVGMTLAALAAVALMHAFARRSTARRRHVARTPSVLGHTLQLSLAAGLVLLVGRRLSLLSPPASPGLLLPKGPPNMSHAGQIATHRPA